MYSALEKLYGLKLFDGLITEDRIPVRFKDNAIAYAESLKPVEPETPETPDVSPEGPETDSEKPSTDDKDNTQEPDKTPETDNSGSNESILANTELVDVVTNENGEGTAKGFTCDFKSETMPELSTDWKIELKHDDKLLSTTSVKTTSSHIGKKIGTIFIRWTGDDNASGTWSTAVNSEIITLEDRPNKMIIIVGKDTKEFTFETVDGGCSFETIVNEYSKPAEFNLVEAIANAEDCSVITLTGNVHLSEPISVNKTLTINLNGHNITSDTSVIYIKSSNGNLSIIGNGNITAGSGGDYFAARAATGKLNIAGGTWSVGADAEGQGNSCIYASGSGEINISGGEFSTDAAYNDKYFVLNRKNGSDSTIVVTGGLFHDYNPADGDDNDGGNFVAVGYTSVFNEEKQAWEIVPAVNNTTAEDNSETEETVVEDNQSEIVDDSTTETTSSEIEETVTEETLVENETEVTE